MRPIIEKTKEIDKIKIYLSLFKLQKSYLLLISDQENQLHISYSEFKENY